MEPPSKAQRPPGGPARQGQASVVMRLDTSFAQVSQDPGFKRRLIWDIAASLRVPQRYIRIAAVEEDGASVAVHLVLQDVDGNASGSTPAGPSRSAAEMAGDLHRQARLPGSNLKMGSCSGSVWQVDTPHWADFSPPPQRPPSSPAPPPPASWQAPAAEQRDPTMSPSAARGSSGMARGRGGRDAGEAWAKEKRAMMDEIRKLQRANSNLNKELTRARSRPVSPRDVAVRPVESPYRRKAPSPSSYLHDHDRTGRKGGKTEAINTRESSLNNSDASAVGVNTTQNDGAEKSESRYSILKLEMYQHWLAIFHAVIALVSVILAVVSHEEYLRLRKMPGFEESFGDEVWISKVLQTFCTMILIIAVVVYRWVSVRIEETRAAHHFTPLEISKYSMLLIVEIFVLIWHPATWLRQENAIIFTSIHGDHVYSLETMLTCAVMTRIYMGLRGYRHFMIMRHSQTRHFAVVNTDVQVP